MDNKRIGVLYPNKNPKTGVGLVSEKIWQSLNSSFPNVERISEPVLSGSLPLSETLKFAYRMRLRSKISSYDTVVAPSQKMIMFDPSKTDTEIITYVHDIFSVTTFYGWRNWSFTDLLADYISKRYIANSLKSDKIIVPTNHVKKEILTKTSYDGSIKVINQGVDNLPEKESEERDIDLLYVGSDIKRKNFSFVQETFRKVQDQGLKTYWVNYKELDLPGEGVSSASPEELAEIYSRSKFILQSSLDEGFGRAPAEAQRYGVIPLAFDNEVNREVLGKEGIDWRSIQNSSDVLEYLIKGYEEFLNEEHRNSEKYKWEEFQEELEDVINKN